MGVKSRDSDTFGPLASTFAMMMTFSLILSLVGVSFALLVKPPRVLWAYGGSGLGVSLFVLFSLRWRAISQDRREGAIVESCLVTGVIPGKIEHMLVKTSRGSVQLVNYTGKRAGKYVRERVLLTYGMHSRIALKMTALPSEGEVANPEKS
jgi:hypothetical protein